MAYIDTLKTKLESMREIDSNGCWLYTGPLTPKGYGIIWCEHRNVRVHRLSIRLYKPTEYKPKLMSLHKCHIRRCFNPEHLYMGTGFDNMQDALKSGRLVTPYGYGDTKTHCKHGHALTEDNIYSPPGTNYRSCKICRKFYKDRHSKGIRIY